MQAKKGFTLIELLVVIAVLGVLASIVLISFRGTREDARLSAAEQFAAQLDRTLDPAAIWNFDANSEFTEGSTRKTRDASRNGNHGTVSTGTSLTEDRSGEADKAYDFQDSGAKVTVPSGTFNDVFNGSFTLALWLKDESAAPAGPNYSIFYKADSASFTSNSVWWYKRRDDGTGQEGNYSFSVRDPNGEDARAHIENPSGDGSGDGKWHHYAVALDRIAGTATGYRDGNQVTQTTFSPQAAITNTGNVIIGKDHNDSSPWMGSIDDVRVFRRALTAEELKQMYAKTAPTYKVAGE